jgi:hypothetical protein
MLYGRKMLHYSEMWLGRPINLDLVFGRYRAVYRASLYTLACTGSG